MAKLFLDITAEIARLELLTLDELREQWRHIHQTPPPRRLSRDILLRGITYKLQEEAVGGLSKAILRKLQTTGHCEASSAAKRRPRLPRDCTELATHVAAEHGNLGKLNEMRPTTVHDVLMRCDVLRRPERFVQMLDACEADKSSRRAVGLSESAGEPFTARADAMAALVAMQSVDAGAVAAAMAALGRPERIAEAVREARIEAIRMARTGAL